MVFKNKKQLLKILKNALKICEKINITKVQDFEYYLDDLRDNNK